MAGRPKRVFTEQQIAQIDDMASINCKDYTIAQVLCIPIKTLKRHFGQRLIEKRAEFKRMLRGYQSNLAKTTPAMAIFLGKNELGQVDRQEIKTETTEVTALTEKQELEVKVMDRLMAKYGPAVRAELERENIKLKGA